MAQAQPSAAKAVYRGMDRAALDAAYNNSVAVADSPQWLARWRERSAQLRGARGSARAPARCSLWQASARARSIIFRASKTKSPLFVFIHGGYWQRNDKDMFAFVADGPRAHGIDVAVLGYTLAPDARLAEIVEEIHQSLTFLAERAGEFGFDRDRLFVGGWSAGGHLTAMAVAASGLSRRPADQRHLRPGADCAQLSQREAQARYRRDRDLEPAPHAVQPHA